MCGDEKRADGLADINLRTDLSTLLSRDPLRWAALETVRSLDLPDCWIGAGFVRDAVWDHLHGYPVRGPWGDVDVVHFDATRPDPGHDRRIENRLRQHNPALDWSVKNQAHMHRRNGDAPYASVSDAMCHWPETATATAIRLSRENRLEINAPFGLEDLFALRIKPTTAFARHKRHIFEQRITEKRWLDRYPHLQTVPA